MRKLWWQDTNHLGAIEDSLELMWQRELLRKGMKKESVLALERFTGSRSLQKKPSRRTKHRYTNKKGCQDCPFHQAAQQYCLCYYLN